ncbi:MAG: hypothetical protein WHS89_05910 [Acidimicrobiales bacterium]
MPAEVLMEPTTRSGVVIALDDAVATIVLTDPEEEWYFPASLVPEHVGVDDVVVIEGAGRSLRIVAKDPLAPSVESRLERSLNRRRLGLR